MREIEASVITETVKRLFQEANYYLPDDVLKAIEAAREKEESPLGENVLDQILANAKIAADQQIALCQDTGTSCVFLDLGQDVHITGGGFPGNIPRVLPPGLGAVIRKSSWSVPPIFRLIQKGGAIDDAEMYRTFNMGIGMLLAVAPEDHHQVEHSLERRGETSFLIGTVVAGAGVVLE